MCQNLAEKNRENKEVGRKMNKTLLRSVREYKKQSVLAPLFVILEVLMEVLIPMEMAKIIDVGIAKGISTTLSSAG